jgi:hypothetical protein
MTREPDSGGQCLPESGSLLSAWPSYLRSRLDTIEAARPTRASVSLRDWSDQTVAKAFSWATASRVPSRAKASPENLPDTSQP